MLRLTGNDSDMSRALQESTEIHAVWTSFAEESDAICAYVDVGTDSGMLLHPNVGYLALPDVNTLTFCGHFRPAIDFFAERIKHSLFG